MRDSDLHDISIMQCNLPIVYWWMEFRYRFQLYTIVTDEHATFPLRVEWIQSKWLCSGGDEVVGLIMSAGYHSEPWDRMKWWIVVGADVSCDGEELLELLEQ
jgi:hypothetical protein